MPTENKGTTKTVTPADKDLILLYHTFCQEMWCASWLSDSEAMRDEYILWLREKFASSPNRIDEWEACAHEIEELPALRGMFTDALGLQIEAVESAAPRAAGVEVTADRVTAHLIDGRVVSAPLVWYPRLARATPEERNGWALRDGGRRIVWPVLDEAISIEGVLAGPPLGENQRLFREWLEAIKALKGMEIFELRQADERKVESDSGSAL